MPVRPSDHGYRHRPQRRQPNRIPAALAALRAGAASVWVTFQGRRLELVLPSPTGAPGEHLVAYNGRLHVEYLRDDGTIANGPKVTIKELAFVRQSHRRSMKPAPVQDRIADARRRLGQALCWPSADHGATVGSIRAELTRLDDELIGCRDAK